MVLRIATFNLENLDDQHGVKPSLEERISVLRPQLQRLRADILCLQEVNAQHVTAKAPRGPRALNQLLEDTDYAGYAWAASGSPGADRLADRHNIIILSHLPIIERQVIHHDHVQPLNLGRVAEGAESDGQRRVGWDRPVLRTTIMPPGGRPLHVFAVHLRAPLAAPIPGQKLSAQSWRSVGGWAEGYFIAAMKRCGQALELRLAIEQLFERHGDAQIIVCGDFNSETHETPMRIVCADEPDTGNRALLPRSLVPLEGRVEASRRYSVLHCGRKLMLDHILCSRALLTKFRHCEVHNEGLMDEVIHDNAHEGPLGSFHAPLVAEFENL